MWVRLLLSVLVAVSVSVILLVSLSFYWSVLTVTFRCPASLQADVHYTATCNEVVTPMSSDLRSGH